MSTLILDTIKDSKAFNKLVGAEIEAPEEIRKFCYFLVLILDESKKPLPFEEILVSLYKVDIKITVTSLHYYLGQGILHGYFKKMASNGETFYTLHNKKVKTKNMPTGIRRPNYGITRSIVDVINEFKGPFYAVTVLEKIEDMFPVAKVQDVETSLKALIRKKTPGLTHSGGGLYLRKQPIKY